MTWLIILASILIPLILIGLQIDDWKRDWTKNHAALEASAENPDLREQELTEDTESVAAAVEAWTETQPAWSVQDSAQDELTVTIHLTRTTKVFRFVDDISVTLSPIGDGAGTLMQAESQSRVGKGDLGQNPRNLIALVRGVRDQLGSNQ